MKILIVDDDHGCRELIFRILAVEGYEPHTADNGRSGVEKALELDPDLILMDMDMPVMDGGEATRMLRKHGFKGPIALCSSTVDYLPRENPLYDHVIGKPFIIDEFLETVKTILANNIVS